MRNDRLPPLSQGQSEVQRERRHRKLIHAEIELESGARISATVTNVSEHGIGLKAKCNLEPFDVIHIVKEGYGRVKGEIRWANGHHFGVLCSQPINVDMFNFTDINRQGHFVRKIDNGHVWQGFRHIGSTKRPGFGR